MTASLVMEVVSRRFSVRFLWLVSSRKKGRMLQGDDCDNKVFAWKQFHISSTWLTIWTEFVVLNTGSSRCFKTILCKF